MSPRQRYHRALRLWIGGGLVLALLAATVSPWLLALLPVWVIALGRYSMSIRCPNCARPIGMRGRSRAAGWSAFAPPACRNCGADLEQAEGGR
jgi:hypothetical protein